MHLIMCLIRTAARYHLRILFSQHNVFINTTKFLLDGLVSGYNATVFAYGATGAGKTYTYFLFKLGCSEQKNSLVI